jgi:SAM-dependent methyltransferase
MADGSAAAQGELWGARARDWAEVQERQVRALYEAVLGDAGVGGATNLLDVGCGSGMAMQLAAERGASVSGLDATEALVEIARQRLPQADLRLGEMEQLPFEDGRFEVVTGFNSFQFAARPAVALAEAGRVARPGGSVAVATWGRPEQCEAAAAYLGVLRSLVPPPPPDAPGPFALSDEGALESLVAEAGLASERAAEVTSVWRYADEAEALRGLLSAGPATAAIRHSGEETVRARLAEAIEPLRTASGGYRMENVFRYLIARA